MHRAPRVVSVRAAGEMELLVRFENGVDKIYDCRQLLGRPEFDLLHIPAFVHAVKVDPGGYGTSWSDDVDLSEYELWVNGRPIAKQSVEHVAGG